MPSDQSLRDLIEKWLAEYRRVSSFHATMGTGWKVCADDLHTMLSASVEEPQEAKLQERFVDTFTELAKRQHALDPVAAKVLYDNLWTLYDDSDPDGFRLAPAAETPTDTTPSLHLEAFGVKLPVQPSSGAESPREQSGVNLIAAERERQKAVEGWTADHDDKLDEADEAIGLGYFPSDGTGRVRAIRELVSASADTERLKATGETSDGYHTFNELYAYRKAYNALLFNEWASRGLYDVHKSFFHSDGGECFGGGWFVVSAQTPAGQITNHYKNPDWDLFRVPERRHAAEWDGHTPAVALQRLLSLALLVRQASPASPPESPT